MPTHDDGAHARWRVAALGFAVLLHPCARAAAGQRPGAAARSKLPQCRKAVVEGSVRAGQGFQQAFAHGMVVGLEPIASGWALRVVAAGKPRGPRDYAEVATLPYQSVSPLLLGTDWAFRAQDAVGWTPRRFHYAGSEAAFAELAASYDAVVRGDAAASRRAALLAEAQPEGLLEIVDATLAPGTANQTRMAAAVSERFVDTPHTVDTKAAPSPLGKVEALRFRIVLDLPQDLTPAASVTVASVPCVTRPTASSMPASHSVSKQNSQ